MSYVRYNSHKCQLAMDNPVIQHWRMDTGYKVQGTSRASRQQCISCLIFMDNHLNKASATNGEIVLDLRNTSIPVRICLSQKQQMHLTHHNFLHGRVSITFKAGFRRYSHLKRHVNEQPNMKTCFSKTLGLLVSTSLVPRTLGTKGTSCCSCSILFKDIPIRLSMRSQKHLRLWNYHLQMSNSFSSIGSKLVVVIKMLTCNRYLLQLNTVTLDLLVLPNNDTSITIPF